MTTKPVTLLQVLRNQTQLDADGVMVGVSRQALDEAIALLERRAPSLTIGPYTLSAYSGGGLRIERDPGESMQIPVEKLVQFWKENY